MLGRVLLLSAALVALVAARAAPNAAHDDRPRLRPSHEWMRRRLVPPPPSARAARDYEELWIDQVLDHFDSTNTATWSQRYFSNAQYHQPGGPVFVFISGESDASPSWVQGGYMFQLAGEHGALAVELEHRYYGESRPTPDTTSENLQYLSSVQALEDLAFFIRFLRQQNPDLDSAKWIVFGGSYAGNLAAWARLRYPDIIDGAVASSGPVLAEANFTEYLEVVGEAIGTFDPECLAEISAASQEFEELLQSDSGVSTINEWFSLCEPLDLSNEYDVAGVSSMASGTFSGVVQYNSVQQGQDTSVQVTCSQLLSSSGSTPLQRLASSLGLGPGSDYCLDPDYESSYDGYISTGWDSGGTRQWLYQTCTEFGYYQTTDSPNQPFGNRLTLPYFTDMCALLYGSEFTAERVEAGVVATNQLYGGRTPDVTNVAFVNGALDPWHALGVLEDLNESSPAIVIEYESHCSDMYDPSSSDIPQLTAAHQRIAELVAQWVS